MTPPPEAPPPEAPPPEVETAVDAPTEAPMLAERVSAGFLRAIPRDFARRHLVVSQGANGSGERLVVAETTSRCVIHNVGVELGDAVDPVVGDPEEIARTIDEAYGRVDPRNGHVDADLPGVESDIERLLSQSDRDLLSTDGKGQVVRLVDALIFDALNRRASDLHLHPVEDRVLIRCRLDGVLQTVRELPRELATPLISRVKVMGRMDIAERRVPQDGRASVTLGDRSVDLRISTLPTSNGERAVIRLLDNATHLCGDFAGVDGLGMPGDTRAAYLERARRSSGIILVTGPTGSGKTTTLYATLREVGSAEVNIMTIEDPIEYDLSSVGLPVAQSQVNARKGVTFATGLRHILRQDPDVVMVGEIRDIETARIAIQSSLTGHLVFSTLHTNDAASAVTRLIDLGIEPYLVSASLSAVLAQRLVRRVHRPCDGEGCPDCLGTGYRGRIGLFELLVVDEAVRERIARQATAGEIRAVARACGIRTLADEGTRLVREGGTSESEVRRVVEGTGE